MHRIFEISKTLILITVFNLLIFNALGQKYRQWKITQDSTTAYLSLSEMLRCNAFGLFRYSIYASTDIKNVDTGPYAKNVMKLGNKESCLFSIVDSETGNVDILKLDYSKYYPLAFINNDTLILNNKINNTFEGYRISDHRFCIISDSLTRVLHNIPSDFVSYRIKISKNFNHVAFFDRNGMGYEITVLSRQTNIPERKIRSDRDFKTWQCGDFFWLDNDNLLLSLLKSNSKGILLYNQKIYNIPTDKLIDVDLPKNGFRIDDFSNGSCIVRTVNGKPQFIIYKLKLEKNKPYFSPTNFITTIGRGRKIIGNLGFMSQNSIVPINIIEGGFGILSLSMVLKEYSPDTLIIQSWPK